MTAWSHAKTAPAAQRPELRVEVLGALRRVLDGDDRAEHIGAELLDVARRCLQELPSTRCIYKRYE